MRILILLLSAAPAAAATFDFTSGEQRSGSTIQMVADGISLDLRGSDGAGQGFDVTHGGGRGLGISGAGDTAFLSTHLESWGASGEQLGFTFDRDVILQSITFTMADFDDRALLGGPEGATTFKLLAGGPPGTGRLTLGGSDWTGKDFSIAPEGWTYCVFFSGSEQCEERGSGFRIASIDVIEAPGIVPLPMAGVLLASGVAGLALIGRRRRAAPTI